MEPLFSGFIHVTGEPDVGKTLFSLQAGSAPEHVAFIDDDIKGRNTVKQLQEQDLKFGVYHDLVGETEGMKEIAFHTYCMRIIDEIIKHGNIEVVVWDTWTRFESSFKPVVAKNPSRFREPESLRGTGEIRGAIEWIIAQDYETNIVNSLLKYVKMVIATTHLKQARVGGKAIPGKFEPRCQRPVIENANMRVWLRQNPSGRPVPIGLMLKRIEKPYMTEAGLRNRNVLPRKVVPRSEDESLWDTIRWYWQNPIGSRAPTADETPNEFELSILDGHLTADQKDAMKLALMEAEEERAVAEAVSPENLARLDITSRIATYLSENPDADNYAVKANVPGATSLTIAQTRATS